MNGPSRSNSTVPTASGLAAMTARAPLSPASARISGKKRRAKITGLRSRPATMGWQIASKAWLSISRSMMAGSISGWSPIRNMAAGQSSGSALSPATTVVLWPSAKRGFWTICRRGSANGASAARKSSLSCPSTTTTGFKREPSAAATTRHIMGWPATRPKSLLPWKRRERPAARTTPATGFTTTLPGSGVWPCPRPGAGCRSQPPRRPA